MRCEAVKSDESSLRCESCGALVYKTCTKGAWDDFELHPDPWIGYVLAVRVRAHGFIAIHRPLPSDGLVGQVVGGLTAWLSRITDKMLVVVSL